ncbi:MAG: Flp family type IVb pilin [Alphaproteobacteria bacterium]|nr:MAG: Flp family type IVb pilin [Alphaproteobacteria bacterium]
MLIKLLKKLRKSEAGATAIEYGLIAALVSVVAIAALTGIGEQLTTTFETVETELSTANGN